MKRSEVAVNKFRDGYCCSQSVLFSFVDKLEISEEMALKIANGFGAGMGRKQEVCGAVSGAVMVIGLLYGRGQNDGKDKHEYTYDRVRDLVDAFEAKHNTVFCKKLLDDCDLLSPQGLDYFRSNNIIERCYGFVEDAVNILEEKIIR